MLVEPINVEIPFKARLVVKSRQVVALAGEFRAVAETYLSSELQQPFCNCLAQDGRYILHEVLGYKNYEQNTSEHILTVVWYLAFNPAFQLSPLALTEFWDELDEETKASYLELITPPANNPVALSSLHLLRAHKGCLDFESIEQKTMRLLKQYLDILIKADDIISESEKDADGLLKAAFDDSVKARQQSPISKTSSIGSPSETLEQLESLVGLHDIKVDIKRLANFVQVNQLREARGLAKVPVALHSVFMGPPGTGKTTVARLYAKLLFEIGILKKGHLIEADRSQLVGGFVGQTAIKTIEILKRAIDGVLFIDEAYTLKSDDGYGQEAIETILKYMEDNRDRMVVIVAGYEARMQSFIRSNPGLESRFTRFFHFPNYKPLELVQIFVSLAEKSEFTVEPALVKSLELEFEKRDSGRDESFGNARYIRNMFELTVQNQFARIGVGDDLTMEGIQLLLAADLQF